MAASASTGASTAYPKPSSSTPRARSSYKHIGPVTHESLDGKVLPVIGSCSADALPAWTIFIGLSIAPAQASIEAYEFDSPQMEADYNS